MNQMSLMFFVVVYGVFIVWYGGKARPLTEVETEDLLAGIWQSQGHASEPDTPIFNELRELVKSDDGRSYYMLNLMKFKTEKANPSDIDPVEARKLYSKGIVRQLIKRGGHPVFVGDVMGQFMTDGTYTDWNQVGIIRYRSRRDMIKMIAEMNDPNLGKYKWASLAETHVFPVAAQLNVGLIRVIVGTLMFGLSILIF